MQMFWNGWEDMHKAQAGIALPAQGRARAGYMRVQAWLLHGMDDVSRDAWPGFLTIHVRLQRLLCAVHRNRCFRASA